MLRAVRSPLFETAAALARAEGERLLAGAEPANDLHVVEFRDVDGKWHPMAGDAYLDAFDAEQCAKRSRLTTRIRVYTPRIEPCEWCGGGPAPSCCEDEP
jgi:hypothetical protein